MSDLLNTFKERAEQLVSAINDHGGIRATMDGLRRQMAAADRRRETQKIKGELRRLDGQITEMITAVGVQAVGLHKSGHLHSPELAPLCQHIVELEAVVAQQKDELAKIEAAEEQEKEQGVGDCPSCGRPLLEGATFCPHCGVAVPTQLRITYHFCPACGTELRPGAKFCGKCGHRLTP
jgi:DNA repair exonuclease SbcCD ATPase subunit